MATQVEIVLSGPHAGMDAEDSLQTLSLLLRVVGELERTEAQRGTRATMSRWAFSNLALGSVSATLEPLRVASDSSFTVIEEALEQMVLGFAAAELRPEIPPRWTSGTAKLAATAVRRLGASADVGMTLSLPGDQPIRAEVTQRAHRNLTAAVKANYTTLGSRRGRLRGLYESTSGGRIRAVLWTETGNERIPLDCPERLREQLRQAWGHERVEVTGKVHENARGQVTRITVEDLEVLREQPLLSDEDLRAGFWPDMTDGLSARQHLAVIRGEA